MDVQRKARIKDWIYYGALVAVSILALSTVLDLLRSDESSIHFLPKCLVDGGLTVLLLSSFFRRSHRVRWALMGVGSAVGFIGWTMDILTRMK